MSVVSRPRRVLPPLAVAALLLVGGCVSAFTNGAADWTPADGEPDCHPELGLAADIILLTVGASTAPTLAVAGAYACESSGCGAFMLTSALFAAGGPTIGVIGGALKTRSCHRAKAEWRRTSAARVERELVRPSTDETITTLDMLDDIAVQTGTEIDIYGDTLILRAPSVELCTSSAWFHDVNAFRRELAARGVTHASCRVGRLTIWDGALPPPSNL